MLAQHQVLVNARIELHGSVVQVERVPDSHFSEGNRLRLRSSPCVATPPRCVHACDQPPGRSLQGMSRTSAQSINATWDCFQAFVHHLRVLLLSKDSDVRVTAGCISVPHQHCYITGHHNVLMLRARVLLTQAWCRQARTLGNKVQHSALLWCHLRSKLTTWAPMLLADLSVEWHKHTGC